MLSTSYAHYEGDDKLASGGIRLGEKYDAEFVKCVDGNTAHFKINGQVFKTRFLYIDTPENSNEIEPYGKEASVFTCNFLKTGKITIETDGESVYDQYGRLLAWVWVGDQLLQEEMTKAGFVEDFYDYGDYLYEDRIISAMEDARKLSKGIYSSDESTFNKENGAKSGPASPSSEEKVSASTDLAKEISQIEKEVSENTKSKGSSGHIISWLIALGFFVFFYKKRIKYRK